MNCLLLFFDHYPEEEEAQIMGLTKDDLAEIFSYRSPQGDDREHYTAIRDKAREFAEVVLEHTPGGPDQTVAIRKIREAVMTANASIALDGKF